MSTHASIGSSDHALALVAVGNPQRGCAKLEGNRQGERLVFIRSLLHAIVWSSKVSAGQNEG